MKELSIEEKAKHYDEAIKKAESLYKAAEPMSGCNVLLETVFPELKESEDERIRKEIIGHFRNTRCVTEEGAERIAKWISWLEKQGEQKPQGKSALEAAKEEKVDNQNCVKPADKVEPKFKVGEWLCENEPNNYARFIQILEIVNVQGKGRYRISRDIHKNEDVVEFGFVEKYYHKFDIQDAKDGDVLALDWKDDDVLALDWKDDEWEWQKIVIFKSLSEFGVEGYGNTFKNNKLAFKEDVPYYSKTWSKCLHPATKEQRDLLFQKMKESGYEWNADKKELKEISQRMVSAEVKEAMYDKPALSKEDEEHIHSLLDRLEGMCKKGATFTKTRFAVNQDIDWLKSLKQRIGG